MLTEIEQQTLDIDWFFMSQNKIGFVASGAGKLPNTVACLDEKLGYISTFFRNLPEITTVIINSDLEIIKKGIITDAYLSDFIYMAKRGLFAFDKTYLNNFSNTEYHLVAKPLEPLKIKQLPVEIINMISSTIYSGNLDSDSLINLDNIS